MSATINLEKKHFPVLLDEIIKIISPRYSGTFLDCTFGQGGYSEKILENPNNKIIAFDRDIKAARLAEKFKRHFKNRFEFSHKKFSDIQSLNEKNIKAIIFDLGYSTDQIFDNEKGLSFNFKGKLNMKMGLNSFSAHDVMVNIEWTAIDLHIFIIDDGPGFTRSTLARAGQPWNSTRAGQEGHRGLGLFIARSLLESIGGSINFANDHLGGGKVGIILPRESLS